MTTTTPAAGLTTRPAAGTSRCDLTELPSDTCAHCLPVSVPDPVVRAPRPPRPQLRPCGTQAAYRRHLARRETPCDACRAAHAQADRRLRQTGTTVERPQTSQETTRPGPLVGDERRAAITVITRAQSDDDARQLLECLGLLGGAA